MRKEQIMESGIKRYGTKKVRCSALPRIMACPASAGIPEFPMDVAGSAAALGTAVHAVLAELIARQGEKDESGITPESIDLFRQAEEHGVEADELRRLTWSGWRMWEQIEDRIDGIEVELEMHSIVGHVDLRGHADVSASVCGKPGTVFIHDWKSGWKEKGYLPQLKGYGLLRLLRDAAASSVIVSVGWLRTGILDVFEFTRDELVAFGQELAGIMGDDCPKFSPSEAACEYCPMKMQCPARRELMVAAGRDLLMISGALVQDASSTEITPSMLVSLYPKSRMLKKLIEEYESHLKAAAEAAGGSIACEEGEISLTECSRKTITYAPEVMAQFMTPEALESLRPTVTKTALEKAVSDSASKGQKGVRKEACFAALAAAGCIEDRPYKILEYHASA